VALKSQQKEALPLLIQKSGSGRKDEAMSDVLRLVPVF